MPQVLKEPLSLADAKERGFCVKCKRVPAQCAVHHAAFCRDCLVFAVTGRVRKRLAAAASDPGAAMLAISGSRASRILLQLVCEHQQARSGSHRGGAFARICAVHVSLGNAEEDARVGAALEASGIEWSLLPFSENPAAFLDQFTAESSREDGRRILLEQLLLQHARIRECSTLLLADTMSRIAERGIELLVKGRGTAVKSLFHAGSDQKSGVAIVRPLRDVLDEELAVFEQDVGAPAAEKPDQPESLGALAARFVQSLQAGYPSTVSAVVRTLDRASVEDSGAVEPRELCVLCGCPRDGIDKRIVSSNGPSGIPTSRLCVSCSLLEIDRSLPLTNAGAVPVETQRWLDDGPSR